MSQPPYPPQGGDEPGGERSGSEDGVGADDPTRRFGSPAAGGQREATQQFGPPEHGLPPYVPPQYGQVPGRAPYPQHGQPQYPPPQYGQPQYPPPQYGQPQYGPPQYGQTPYVPYGQPAYGSPWGPPAGPGGPWPKKNKNAVVALVVGAVLVMVAIGIGLFFLLGAGGPTSEFDASGGSSGATGGPSGPAGGDGEIPAATVSPEGLGDDPDLDELAQACYSGEMVMCDELYELAETDTLYSLYGGTCAGRQGVSDADTVFCTEAFPED